MKTINIRFILLIIFISFLFEGHAQVYVVNTTDCQINWQVYCQNSSCETQVDPASGNISAGNINPPYLLTWSNCPNSNWPYFAYLRFRFPDGDNIWRTLAFDPDLPNGCASLECTLEPYAYHSGVIEADYCLGAIGEVRSDLMDGVCTIYFKYAN